MQVFATAKERRETKMEASKTFGKPQFSFLMGVFLPYALTSSDVRIASYAARLSAAESDCV